MITFKQIRNFLVTMVLAIMLAITIGFDFGTSNSWAATSSISSISSSDTQLIAMWGGEKLKEVESQAQEMVDNLTDDIQTKSAQKAEQFKTETLEGLNTSIVNPNYQPSGKTKQVEKQDREATKAIEEEARETFN